jgi:hypothetical protein
VRRPHSHGLSHFGLVLYFSSAVSFLHLSVNVYERAVHSPSDVFNGEACFGWVKHHEVV